MTFWENCNPAARCQAYFLLGVLSLFSIAAACNSVPSPRKSERKTAVAQDSANPGWDLNCIYERIQNPPESFHYTYKHDSSDWEADITPSTIDGTVTDGNGTRQIHGVRSDRQSWQGASLNLGAISGAASTFALVRNAESTHREGSEAVNGHQAIKYSVDTTRATSVESALYRGTLGQGGFEKGSVWVTSDGCPVKFVIDAEMHLNNGEIVRNHYEEAIIRK